MDNYTEQGFYHPDRGYWQTTGIPTQEHLDEYPTGTIRVPIRPDPDHVWMDPGWLYVAPDPSIALAAWRSTAVLARTSFCIALKEFGFLTAAEAIAAAQGSIPSPMEAAITMLPQKDQDDARILWAGLTQVERNHPLVLLVGWYQNLTDSQLDRIFGWIE